jgi:hypothetical protein
MDKKYIENVVVGYPIVPENKIFASSNEDWDRIEKEKTFYTNETFLPNILVELGVCPSKGEIRRNKPQLMISLDKLDFMEIKWGKKRLFFLVGFPTEEERDKYIENIEKEEA